MRAADPGRRRALDNRRFRTLLLVLAGAPIVLLYLWHSVAAPIVSGAQLGDFQASYMRAAGRIAAGLDPFDLCQTMGCLEPTGPQYVTPLPLAWMLQPLVSADPRLVSLGVLLILNTSLALFLFCVVRVLKVRDWQLIAVLVLIAIAFEPVGANVDEGQINLVLLALSGLWLLSWVSGGWAGGLALGLGVALKVIQAPVGLLVLWGRRWWMAAAAAVVGVGLWLIAVPQYLSEYLTSVLPTISQGTGLYENHSPGGTITRLFDPNTFFGAVRGSPPAARLLTDLVAVLAIVVTLAALRSPSTARGGRVLEAAAFVAVTPLVASYSWGTHLVLLLAPILILIEWGIRRRDRLVVALVGLGWLLIGPGHNRMQALLVSGYSNLTVLRVMAEFGVVGVLLIWAACLIAARRERRMPVIEVH